MMAPPADVRGFYAALGIELVAWAQREAPVRCFANPDAHNHRDRNPSCSVNLENGVWHCWGCGAAGGAYDAAIVLRLTPRAAIDLMIACCLTTRRAELAGRSGRVASPRQPAIGRPPTPTARVPLATNERQLADAQRQLAALPWPPRVLRDAQRRLWSHTTLLDLGCGWQRGRVLIPILGGQGQLRGVLRYAPSHDHVPKMLAVRGTRLGLIPHPTFEQSAWVMLVEGPPDMLTARSQGLPALAVPGDDAWQPDWAQLLSGRRVTIALDCDRAGRGAASRIAEDLSHAGVERRIVDLAPDRRDGFDLTEWLDAQHQLPRTRLPTLLGAPSQTITEPRAGPS